MRNTLKAKYVLNIKKYQKKKNYQRTIVVGQPICYALLVLVFVTNIFGYLNSLVIYLFLVILVFYHIRIFPKPETVDYIITKESSNSLESDDTSA